MFFFSPKQGETSEKRLLILQLYYLRAVPDKLYKLQEWGLMISNCSRMIIRSSEKLSDSWKLAQNSVFDSENRIFS